MTNPTQAKIDAIMADETEWSYVLTKVCDTDDLDDSCDVISAENIDRIDDLAQQAQQFMHQSETVLDHLNVGIAQGYFSGDEQICAIAEMTQRASKTFVETEVVELVNLTMKLGRVATEAKRHVFK